MTIKTVSISKTTLNGILAFFIAAVPFLQAYPQLHIPPTVAAWLSAVAGLARLAVGIMQTDADTVKAMIPGVAEPVNVPAHPVPDNPAATPVIASKPPVS